VFLKRYWYPLAASALIVCAMALRLALILLGWPHSNSEEGTMGLEAMHILLRSEHPIYLYGQRYMGVGEAYAGALAYRIFGISTVALRLGMVACYACFMVGVCWLASLLYSRRVALVSLAALALGTPFLVKIELLADGGKAETMALGALLFALASWLALTQPAAERAPRRQRALRAAGFVAWGVMAGFGLYTYIIIAPFVLTTGLLLWLTCQHELRGWALSLPLAGLLVGLSPDILSTATTPLAANPIAVFWSLHQSLNQGGASGALLLLKQMDATLLYTLPTVTGLVSLYPAQALPLYGPPTSATIAAILIGGGWSLGYLALLTVATYRPLRALGPAWALRWTTWSTAHRKSGLKSDPQNAALAYAPQASTSPMSAQGEAQGEARHLARLLLALTAWLTIAAYMFSATAANNPNSGRYMIGLLVIVPAVLWPLLDPAPRASGIVAAASRLAKAAMRCNAWRLAAVTLLGVSLVLGALSTAQTVPNEVAADGRDAQFIHDLLSRGVTRFYADYWTCDLLNFETRERLTCAVVDDYGRPGLTRYRPYLDAVRADPAAPYVLAHGSVIERTFLLQAEQNHQRFAVQSFDGHDMYIPAGA
jgi:hypothetical protein